jgi:hypothetical protein
MGRADVPVQAALLAGSANVRFLDEGQVKEDEGENGRFGEVVVVADMGCPLFRAGYRLHPPLLPGTEAADAGVDAAAARALKVAVPVYENFVSSTRRFDSLKEPEQKLVVSAR